MFFSKFSFFKKGLPFLSLKVGLVIDDSSLKIVCLSRNRVRAWAEIVLKKGVIEGGWVLRPRELEQSLVRLGQDLLAQLPSRYQYFRLRAIVALPEQRTYFHRAPISFVSAKETKAAVRQSLEDNLPVPVSELNWDYRLLGGRDKSQEFIALAAPNKLINQYRSALERAGFSLETLEPESSALHRFFWEDQKAADCLILLSANQGAAISLWDRQSQPVVSYFISDHVKDLAGAIAENINYLEKKKKVSIKKLIFSSKTQFASLKKKIESKLSDRRKLSFEKLSLNAFGDEERKGFSGQGFVIAAGLVLREKKWREEKLVLRSRRPG